MKNIFKGMEKKQAQKPIILDEEAYEVEGGCLHTCSVSCGQSCDYTCVGTDAKQKLV